LDINYPPANQIQYSGGRIIVGPVVSSIEIQLS
jgi:hypothetical protein